MMAHVIVKCVRNQSHMILLLEYSQKFASVVYFQRNARLVKRSGDFYRNIRIRRVAIGNNDSPSGTVKIRSEYVQPRQPQFPIMVRGEFVEIRLTVEIVFILQITECNHVVICDIL